MKGYVKIADEKDFQVFDNESDLKEDITGKPRYIAIDGILYEKVVM